MEIDQYFEENDNTSKFVKHVSTETSAISVHYWTKRYKLNLLVGKNANYASNNGMYIKRDQVRITRKVLDLHDAIADSKKVVVFEYEMPLLS